MTRLFAHFFSTLFHPLLMVTYGVLIALKFTMLQYVFYIKKAILLSGAFLFSAFLPALLIFILIKIKLISDYEIDKKEERMIPYLVTIICLVATLCFFISMLAPYWLIGLTAGMTVALGIALLINKYWKISAHGMGVGGMSGALLCITPLLTVNPLYLFIPSLLAAGFTGTARILLGRHTFGQVMGGILLGAALAAAGVLISYLYILKT